MSLVAPARAGQRRCDRAPLMRFRPLQRSLARDALSAAAKLWTIPLRRFPIAARPARPRKARSTTSPMRFYALRTRCGEARHADVPVAGFARLIAPRERDGYTCSQCRQRLRSLCGDGRCNRRDLATQRPVTSSATASLIRRSELVMHRRVLLARCSATSCEPSRPGRTTGPSLWSSGGAPGVHSALRRFAPEAGDRSSRIDRAHVPVRPAACPD
jgi:hypothetical protein